MVFMFTKHQGWPWLIDEILHDGHIEKKSIEMNYHNYKGKIVEKYGV